MEQKLENTLFIKKFQLTYNQIPEVFSLSSNTYLSDSADSIPEEISAQTEEQRQEINNVINQIDIDLDRTNYVDFDGHKASELKAYWLTRNLDGVSLTKNVYPNYTQGNSTGASVGEVLFLEHAIKPLTLNPEKSDLFVQVSLEQKKICFAYRNKNGESAGFSLSTAPTKDYKGWIISTIQNTTANPKDRKVTVLASSNYVVTQEHSRIDSNDKNSLMDELKEAINNDKVFKLIQTIFKQDGSLDIDTTDLESRIGASRNIDNRDTKISQLNCLFELSQSINDPHLQNTLTEVKTQINQDINFFKDGVYEEHLENVVNTLAMSLTQQPNVTKSQEEIKKLLKKISERIADLEYFAEQDYRNIEKVNAYKALAQQTLEDAKSIKFDGTQTDEIKIAPIILMETFNEKEHILMQQMQQELDELKRQNTQDEQTNLNKLKHNQPNSSFLNRNQDKIVLGVVLALAVSMAIGFALTGILAPLAVGVIAVASAVIFTASVGGISIYLDEKDHAKEVKNYNNQINKVKNNSMKKLQDATQEIKNKYGDPLTINEIKEKLQNNIDSYLFLKPDENSLLDQTEEIEQEPHNDNGVTSSLKATKPEFLSKIKSKPMTPETVAHALWLQDKGCAATTAAKNRFSLWAEHKNLGFGIKEVDAVIEKTYEMKKS